MIALWGGVECTLNRVGDRYHDQLTLTGHADRIDDLDRIVQLGIRTLRYPILWESARDWAWTDARIHRLRELGIDVIAGLVHHGSGPPGTSLLQDSFISGLAEHARSVAERYPWIRMYTPINEPLTTARFSCLYGHWYPHLRSLDHFHRAVEVQVDATVTAMQAIRRVRPDALLVQTEDFGAVRSTDPLRYQADYENERRWMGFDRLFQRCPPDLIGINYYVTSDRFLDHRLHDYPPHLHGGNGRERYVDVELVRVPGDGIRGHKQVLEETWQRYQTPLAITEVHLGCSEEEQVSWLCEAWHAARAADADVRAVTAWSLFGAYDWNSLVTVLAGAYEPGAFDVREGVRETAIGETLRQIIATGDTPAYKPGWWRRPERILKELSDRLTVAVG